MLLQGAFQAGAFAPANVAGPEDGASRARIQGLAAEHRLLAIQVGPSLHIAVSCPF